MFWFLFFVISLGQGCTFTNWNFTDTLSNGWTISQSNPTPYIDGTNYLVLGDTTTETTGNASVYQDFTISSCDQNLTINYSPYTKDNSDTNDQQFIRILNPSNNDVVATIFSTLLGFNFHFAEQWYSISCNICDGSCGGINLSTVGFSPLRLEIGIYQKGNLNSVGQMTPSAFIINDVCLQ